MASARREREGETKDPALPVRVQPELTKQGEMSEWSKVPFSKNGTCQKRVGGSNPPLSAM